MGWHRGWAWRGASGVPSGRQHDSGVPVFTAPPGKGVSHHRTNDEMKTSFQWRKKKKKKKLQCNVLILEVGVCDRSCSTNCVHCIMARVSERSGRSRSLAMVTLTWRAEGSDTPFLGPRGRWMPEGEGRGRSQSQLESGQRSEVRVGNRGRAWRGRASRGLPTLLSTGVRHRSHTNPALRTAGAARVATALSHSCLP